MLDQPSEPLYGAPIEGIMKQALVRRIWMPTFYFLYFGAGACLAPFLSVYLRHIGLSPGRVGLLVSVIPVMLLFGGPVWSAIADAFRRHRPVMILAMSCAAGFALVISRSTAVGWLFLFIAGYAFFNAPIMPIADNATLGLLGEERDQYGRIRLWGGVAWGIVGALIGVIAQRGGLSWPFFGYAALMLIAIPISTQLPLTRAELPGPFWRGLRSLVADRRWYVFLTAVFVCGIALSAITNFLFLYLQALGGRETLMGLSLTVATVAELPFFVVTNRLVRKIGPHRLFLMGMLAFVLRFALYSVIRNPWVALAVQVLHGPSFVAVWVAGVSYADEISPPGLGATAQSIFSATLMGLGSAAGGVLSGALFGAVGPFWMFRTLAMIVLLGFAGFWIAHSRLRRVGQPPRGRVNG